MQESMKKIMFYLLLLPLTCCKGKDRVKESEPFIIVGIEEESTRAPVREFHVLDSAIIDQLVWYINFVEQECDTMWNDRKCYTIDFYGKDSTRECHPNDTLVSFSCYNLMRKDYKGYRGILRIAGRRVAILDKDCVGEHYYDTSKLDSISLECNDFGWLGRYLHPYVCYLEDGWFKSDRSVVKFNYRKEWGIDMQELEEYKRMCNANETNR